MLTRDNNAFVNAYDYISMRGGPTLGQIMSQFLIDLEVLPPQALIAMAAQLVMMGGCFVLSLYLTNNFQAKMCHCRLLSLFW
jgi:hypothetical protein